MATPRPSEREWLHQVAANCPSSPQFSYATIGTVAALFVTIIGAVWTNTNQQIDAQRRMTEASDARLAAELQRRETELRTGIASIQQQLENRRDQFVGIKAHEEFEKRVLNDIKTLRERAMLIEQSRLSVGEFQAATNALRDRIEKLYGILEAQQKQINDLTKRNNQ